MVGDTLMSVELAKAFVTIVPAFEKGIRKQILWQIILSPLITIVKKMFII